MSSRPFRFRAAAVAFGSVAVTFALAVAPLSAGAVPTLGAPQTLHFSEWFAVGPTVYGITPNGTVYGAGNLYVAQPTTYSRAIVWNGTTPVDITPGNRNYQCVTEFASDTGVSAGVCQNPVVWFIHSGSTTTVAPAGDVVEGVASNGVALIRYPDGAGTSLGLYSNGVLTRVTPSQPAGGASWDGFAVNSSGLVIGSGPSCGMCAISAGKATPVDPQGSVVQGELWTRLKLTDSGYFYDYSGNAATLWHGSVTTAGVWTWTHVRLAAPAGGSVQYVNDLNESGVVVGNAFSGSYYRAARWSSTGAITLLSATESDADAVNAAGVAVGTDTTASEDVPAIWSGTTELQPYQGKTGATSAFQVISDTGRIAGFTGGNECIWQLTG
jgi:hypothetical protein